MVQRSLISSVAFSSTLIIHYRLFGLHTLGVGAELRFLKFGVNLLGSDQIANRTDFFRPS
jgi:hypothetical protein